MRSLLFCLIALFSFDSYARSAGDTVLRTGSFAGDTVLRTGSFADTTDTIIEPVLIEAEPMLMELHPAFPEPKVSFLEKNKSWLKPTAQAAAVGISWLIAYNYLDKPVQQQSQVYRSKNTEFVASIAQPFGRGHVLQPIQAGLILTGLLPGNKKFMKAGIISATSYFLNDAITTKIKETAQRHRPNSSADNHVFDGPDGENIHHSFPSGHTSNAFATATAIAIAFKENKAVPIIAYGAATMVGLSRIHDNVHWTSDVIAGAVVGYLSARAVGKLYDYGEKKWVRITPSFGRDFKGLSLAYRF